MYAPEPNSITSNTVHGESLIHCRHFAIDGEIKAMKSSPLLGPFCGSEFWGFENIARLGVFMFQISDNSQLCIDSQYSSQ